jgi:hypothetical protein
MPPTLRRKHDKLATNLLFTSFAIGSLVDFYTKTGIYTPDFHTPHISTAAYPVIFAITVLLVLLHYYCVRLGYRWAKILFFILFAGNLLLTVSHLEATLAKQLISPLKSTSFFVQWALQAAATILLVLDLKGPREDRPLPKPTITA